MDMDQRLEKAKKIAQKVIAKSSIQKWSVIPQNNR